MEHRPRELVKEREMIIDIGTEVDESVIRWKHKETDEWQEADIDELIDAYESINEWADLVNKLVMKGGAE